VGIPGAPDGVSRYNDVRIILSCAAATEQGIESDQEKG
jgi:hypothetical protein